MSDNLEKYLRLHNPIFIKVPFNNILFMFAGNVPANIQTAIKNKNREQLLSFYSPEIVNLICNTKQQSGGDTKNNNEISDSFRSLLESINLELPTETEIIDKTTEAAYADGAEGAADRDFGDYGAESADYADLGVYGADFGATDEEDSVNTELIKENQKLNQILNNNTLNDDPLNMILNNVKNMDNIQEETIEPIFDNFIYLSDNIKTVKTKIAFNIFRNKSKIIQNCTIPNYQYLFIDHPSSKVPLGIKWYLKNQVFNFPLTPEKESLFFDANNTIWNILTIEKLKTMIMSKFLIYFNEDSILLENYTSQIPSGEPIIINYYDIFQVLTNIRKSYSHENLLTFFNTYTRFYFPNAFINFNNYEDIRLLIKEPRGNNENPGNNETPGNAENFIIKIKKFLNKNYQEYFISKVINKIIDTTNKQMLEKQNILQFTMNSVLKYNNQTLTFNNINSIMLEIFNKFKIDDEYFFIRLTSGTTNNTVNDDDIQPEEEDDEKTNQNVIPGQKPFEYSNYASSKFNIEFINNRINQNPEYANIVNSWFVYFKPSLMFKIADKKLNKDITARIDVNGLNYKINFKENENITIDQLKNYEYIGQRLIKKINKDLKKSIIQHNNFNPIFLLAMTNIKIANINYPSLKKYLINAFMPYIALVSTKGLPTTSFDTEKICLLRYKRINNYNNPLDIKDKIKLYITSKEATQETIEQAISKEFNISIQQAREYFNKVIKNKKIKPRSGILPKLDLEKQKIKLQGIETIIQGNEAGHYKLKVTSARNINQLIEINLVINVLLYLYNQIFNKHKINTETNDLLSNLNIYIKKQDLSPELQMSNEKEKSNNTRIADKNLLFTPSPGQFHWSRLCQNSGKIHRQPVEITLEDIIKQGLTENENGVFTTFKNNKKIKVMRFTNDSSQTIYYTCTPEVNGKYQYIGALSKIKSPQGNLLPCCFIKDKVINSLTDQQNKNDRPEQSNQMLRYIVQNTNKIIPGRFGLLPRILDDYFNKILFQNTIEFEKNIKILKQTDQYYLKIGVLDDNLSIFRCLAYLLDIPSIEDLIAKLKKCIKSISKNDFLAINNGAVALEYETPEKYFNSIETLIKNPIFNIEVSQKIADLVLDFVSLPGVLNDTGLFLIIMKKSESFIIHQPVNIELFHNFKNTKIPKFLIYQELGVYYPIVLIQKSNQEKEITTIKPINDKMCNALQPFLRYYYMHMDVSVCPTSQNLNVKSEYQIIDKLNLVRFLVVDNYLIPTIPSRIINCPILEYTEKNIKKFCHNCSDTIQKLETYHFILINASYSKIKIQNGQKMYKYNYLIFRYGQNTNLNFTVPTNKEYREEIPLIKSFKLKTYEKLDKYIENPEKFNKTDKRIQILESEKQENKSYQLFKKVISDAINQSKNNDIRDNIIRIINSNQINLEKEKLIKKIIYRLINSDDLKQIYNKYSNDTIDIDTKTPALINIINTLPPKKGKDNNLNMQYGKDQQLILTDILAVKFINKIIAEIIENLIKRNQILHINNNSIHQNITLNPELDQNTKLLYEVFDHYKSSGQNELFLNWLKYYSGNNENQGKTGKKKFINKPKKDTNPPDFILKQNSFITGPEYDKQLIIPNDNTVLRAFCNGMYYLQHKQNLGFISYTQDQFLISVKTKIIDHLLSNLVDQEKDPFEYSNTINKLYDITQNAHNIQLFLDCSIVFNYPIIFWNNVNQPELHIFDNEISKKFDEINIESYKKTAINIQLVEENIYVLYFK